MFHQIGRLISNLADGHAGSIIGIAIILLAALSVVVVATRYSRTVRADPAGGRAVVTRERRPARDWLADAVAFERSGSWRNAVRCRYRALVAELAGRGVIEEVPGTTSGEYRTAVAHRAPEAGRPFSDASALFERAWYGQEAGSPEDTDEFRRLADEVLTTVGRR